MPLRLFTPAMTTPLRLALSVTIRPDFRLCFNAHTSRALHSASLRRVHLFGDPLTQLVLRPAPLDAPHTHLITFTRPFGSAATQFTASLVSGRSVTVHVTDKDKYGRSIAHITTDQGLDLSTELIRAGLAWWYRQYSRNLQLGFLETQARDAHRGLWIDPNPTPPSVWRHAR